MTIDKIKHYMSQHIYNYWCDMVNDKSLAYEYKLELLRKAQKKLSASIKNDKNFADIKYHAELELITYFLS